MKAELILRIREGDGSTKTVVGNLKLPPKGMVSTRSHLPK